jgi:lysozyme
MPLDLDSEYQIVLKNMLVQEEGYSQFPYRDTEGVLTLGIGRNLESNGVSMSESLFMLDNDVNDAIAILNKQLSCFNRLDRVRQIILIDMVFNLKNRLFGFVNTLAAIERGDYKLAAQEMLNSKWAKQVGRRAVRLSKMMETGQYCEL